MAIAHQFEYVKPGTLREAVKTLGAVRHRARGSSPAEPTWWG